MSQIYSAFVLTLGILAFLVGFLFLWSTVFHRFLIWFRYHFLSLGLRFVTENFPENSVSARFADYMKAKDAITRQLRLRELMAALDNLSAGGWDLGSEEYRLMIERLMGDFCTRLQGEAVLISVKKLTKVAEVVESKVSV